MEMTIDKIIKRLLWFEDYNEDNYCGGDRIQDEHGDWYYKVNSDDFEAFKKAANIVRKYQKIEQIMSENYLYEFNKMKDIKKVLGGN